MLTFDLFPLKILFFISTPSWASAADGALPPGDPPEPDQGAHRRGQDRLPRPAQVYQGVPRVQGQEAADGLNSLNLGDLRRRGGSPIKSSWWVTIQIRIRQTDSIFSSEKKDGNEEEWSTDAKQSTHTHTYIQAQPRFRKNNIPAVTIRDDSPTLLPWKEGSGKAGSNLEPVPWSIIVFPLTK